MAHIALIGDYSAAVPAHQAIPLALKRANHDSQLDVSWEWIATRDLRAPAEQFKGISGVWVVPASPYENTAGVLAAIQWAREALCPFLGTCGGFQHALLEFARNVLQLVEADHAESNPTGGTHVISQLTCPLDGSGVSLAFAPGSRIQKIYGRDSAQEAYRCSFGLNPSFRVRFERAGLNFTAFDEAGEPRAAELPATVHPFFIGTLFQPERAAFRGETPPLARAFLEAAAGLYP